jgi:hypothetical protein
MAINWNARVIYRKILLGTSFCNTITGEDKRSNETSVLGLPELAFRDVT